MSLNLEMVGSVLLVQCLLLIVIAKKIQRAKEKVLRQISKWKCIFSLIYSLFINLISKEVLSKLLNFHLFYLLG